MHITFFIENTKAVDVNNNNKNSQKCACVVDYFFFVL